MTTTESTATLPPRITPALLTRLTARVCAGERAHPPPPIPEKVVKHRPPLGAQPPSRAPPPPDRRGGGPNTPR